jgi:hypothetical protein
MFDSPWFVATGIALLLLAASMLPDRYRHIVAGLSALAAVVFLVIGFTRRSEITQEPPRFGTLAIIKPFPDQNCVVVTIVDKGATAREVKSCFAVTRANGGVTEGKNAGTDEFVTNVPHQINICPVDKADAAKLKTLPFSLEVQLNYVFQGRSYNYCWGADYSPSVNFFNTQTAGDCKPESLMAKCI